MLWHRQAIFESKGDKLSSSAECSIRAIQGLGHKIASRLNSRLQTDWAIEDQAKTWTRQPVPMISEHSAHSTPQPFGICTWLWRYTCLLLLISMLWHRQAIFESKGDKLSSSSIIITQGKQIIIIFPHSKQTWGKPVLDIKALLLSWNTKLTSVQVITCLLRTLKASYCKNVYDQILQFPTLNCYYCITKHTVHVIISYVLNPLMKHTQCVNHYFTVINMNLSNLCCNLCTELIWSLLQPLHP